MPKNVLHLKRTVLEVFQLHLGLVQIYKHILTLIQTTLRMAPRRAQFFYLLLVYSCCCCCFCLLCFKTAKLTSAQTINYPIRAQDIQLIDCDNLPSAQVRSADQTKADQCNGAQTGESTTNYSDAIKIVGPKKNSTSNSSLISVELHRITYRQVDKSECANNSEQADVVCSPKVGKQDQHEKQVEVYIVSSWLESNNGSEFVSQQQSSWSQIKLGTSNLVSCRFKLTSNLELKLKLRWLRSVNVGPQNFKNQSIGQSNEQTVTISAESKRSWTIQRENGLDLYLNEFKSSDAGDYFCQALLLDDKNSPQETILDEKRIHLSAGLDETSEAHQLPEVNYNEDTQNTQNLSNLAKLNHKLNLYSQENLKKLLPSLQVVPEYSEVDLGATIQLACVTSELDPDPKPELIKWSYEPFERPGYK